MDFQHSRLIDLINYVEATERDKLKTVLDVAQHKGFNYAEADLADLPGVVLNRTLSDDVIWLEVARLSKRPPPAPDDVELRCWIILADNTETAPKIRSEMTGRVLVDAGLIDAANVLDSVQLDDYEYASRLTSSFDSYVAGPWAQWSVDERQRRRTIALYNALFAMRQLLDGASETPIELVCGIGFSTLYRANQRMRHPLLTVQMEIALNDISHAIEVRPRLEALPGIEADVLDKMELVSVDEWQNFAAKFLVDLEDEPLSPFARESFEPLLRRAVALLDPDALYTPDQHDPQNRNMPSVETTLQISDVFGFFQRERRATQLMEDLRRFRLAIESGGDDFEFPAAINAVVTDPADVPSDEVYPAFRGISTIPGITSSDGSGQDLFFPKPFNREQVEVVQRLALRPGVVVQGPPGTGKTHTIANIISHYLALGKRVLVTSQKAPALKVLRGQLPAAIRPLAVSLLDSDRDGLKQFQESVDIIAERLQRTKRHELAQEISDLDLQIDNLHRALAKIDREVDGIGRSATAPVDLEGEQIEPLKAASEVVADRERSEWLDDIIDVAPEFAPSFSDRDVIALRQARKLLGQDLAYIDVLIPRPDYFPDDDALVSIHRDLSRAETLRRQIAAGELVELIDHSDETIGRVEVLLASLKDIQLDRASISDANFDWTEAATALLRRWDSDEAIDALETMRPAIDSLSDEARHFLTRPIVLPDDVHDDAKLIEAIARCANGETGVGLVAGIFASKLKARLASIRIIGQVPRSATEWLEIKRFIDGLLEAQRLKLSWNHAVAHTPLDATNVDGLAVGRALQSQLDHLASIRELIAAETGLELDAVSLLPRWAKPVSASPPSTSALMETVESHLLRHRLDRAEAIRVSLGDKLRRCGGELSNRFRECVAHDLGNPEVGDAAFRQKWVILKQELDALCNKESALSLVKVKTDGIEANGAPLWAARLRNEPVEGQEDVLTPGDWNERWRLRRLVTWLSRIDRHGRLRALSVERTEKENLLKQAYERSIEQRTWLELRTKATDSVQSALAAYAGAIRRIGKGTGKSAARYRRNARAASDRAKGALPCWIMPHYRVSESLPSDLGLFDLVIIDEASQSTLAALPALLRAKQILIVGDDKQSSPENVGLNLDRADELARRHLSDQVPDYRADLRQEKSLFDLGKVIFAGGVIMLIEHFRCVAPIIEYSKAQFYGHRLLPLRLPTASQRLDPPLIDIFVEDGIRKGMTNPAEADCIVSEIQTIADDPIVGKRTIGVTTLLGQEQAALIYKKIEQNIGTEVMERHQIRVGDPTAFQGDERDIMFVSLVAVKKDMALSGERFNQRFNVAASRAKDRMILVRSVELDDLQSGDELRRSLLQHFRVPFPSEGQEAVSRRERCESPFETELFDMLAERGFRIDTQVRVGTRRIDLVVEGENDRRLAIECDGDRYHGPDKWSDDMVRQRILERAGWEIWRCFASRFVRDRDGVLEELLALLRERGIEPVGASEGWVSRHTEQRRWRTPSVDNDLSNGLFDEEDTPVLQEEATDEIPKNEPPPVTPQPSLEAPVTRVLRFPAKPTKAADAALIPSVAPPKTNPADRLDLFGATASTLSSALNGATSGMSRVTENDVQIAILNLMKNRGQWTNAELKRQLRTVLPLSPADMAQANFRPNEEKWEELVNNALSQSRSNSLHSKGLVKSHSRGRHLITDLGIARVTSDTTNGMMSSPRPKFKMTAEKARIALIELREREIKPNHPDADPARGLLRKSMIEELLRTKPTTEAEFRVRIRQDLREATDGEQFQKYITKVFDILDMLA